VGQFDFSDSKSNTMSEIERCAIATSKIHKGAKCDRILLPSKK